MRRFEILVVDVAQRPLAQSPKSTSSVSIMDKGCCDLRSFVYFVCLVVIDGLQRVVRRKTQGKNRLWSLCFCEVTFLFALVRGYNSQADTFLVIILCMTGTM